MYVISFFQIKVYRVSTRSFCHIFLALRLCSRTDLVCAYSPLVLFAVSLSRVAFRLLGLCNNFAYVVMLSAAHDILQRQESANATATVSAQQDGRQ